MSGELFINYAKDFEQTYVDDDWGRLTQYFHEDVTYEVCNVPYHCVISGRDSVFRGLKKSLDGFDRRCERVLHGPSVFKIESDKVLSHGGVTYKHNDSEVEATLWIIASYKEDRIQRLLDVYTPGVDENYLKWIGQWDDGLDAAYV